MTAIELGEDPRYRLAYDEALRSIGHQEKALDELRSRAGLLLAALSVATSFLGGAAVDAHGFGPMAGVAIGLFAAAGLVLVSLLLPRTGWMFRFDPAAIIGDYVETEEPTKPATISAMHRDLALHLGDNCVANEDRIDRLWRRFQLACTLMVVEVGAWVVALAHL